jgi:alginate O-acetyltransferase complex protein AlgI
VLLAVVLSFVLFNGDSLSQVGADFAGLFGFGGVPAVTAETLYYLRSYCLLFAAGFAGATPIVKNMALRLEKTKLGAVLEVLLLAGILLVCTAYLVDGSFSPFLYFRF